MVFQDEVHFQAQTTITRKWVKKGSEPKVKSYTGRQKLGFSGFVIPESGTLCTQQLEWFTFESIIQSLRLFLQTHPLKNNQKYYLVMDNAPWHKKAKRIIKENSAGQYSDLLEKYVFVYMPPYSPDLNPIEQVWRKTRREVTHNRFFASVTDLKNKLIPYFKRFSRPNEFLRSLCSFRCFIPTYLLQYEH